MDDFSSDSNSSDQNVKRQKSTRLDAFAAKLAARSAAASMQPRQPPAGETGFCIECGDMGNCVDGVCQICRGCSSGQSQSTLSMPLNAPLNAICRVCTSHIANMSTVRCCCSCKKYVHRDCDRSESPLLEEYVCNICRRSPLVGDAMLSAPGPTSPLGAVLKVEPAPSNSSLDDFAGSSAPSDMNAIGEQDLYQLPPAVQHHHHSVSEEASNGISSPATTTDSARNSPTFYPEKTPSDDEEEFKPPGSYIPRGRGRGRGGAKKKPGRGADLMKTRSGGQPPTGSTRGKRGKGSRGAYKTNGKGTGTRGRRGRGQLAAAATTANVMHHLQTAAYSTVREVDEVIEEPEESRQRADEIEYVRTAVVCCAEDPFLENAHLCLICGSVGKGEECSFVSCANCAQTYHTYCVGLHDKMRDTIVRRGWRCLDCTVCEGCGEGRDESKLLLCEECDTAFHIYCLDPPLQAIPSGAWRCQWCARCRRCNVRVSSGADLTREGLCAGCHSLRKCPKCTKLYQLGDHIIRCSSCTRWYHGRCEGLYTVEEMETAAANKMRCSNCRPAGGRLPTQAFGANGQLIVVDNVILHKEADEILKSPFVPPQYRSDFSGDAGSGYRSHSVDFWNNVEEDLQEELQEISSGRGRMRGPGRRVMKLGVGGFVVRVPKSKMAAEEEEGEDGQKKIKKPRKPRRTYLEDAYPPSIQEGFFGCRGVEGKQLIDIQIEEPVLRECTSGGVRLQVEAGTLSAEQALQLQNDIEEQGMLEHVNIDEYNIDDFDLSGLLGESGDEFDEDMNDDLKDAFDVARLDGFDPAAARAEENGSVGGKGSFNGMVIKEEERTTPIAGTSFGGSVSQSGSLSRSSSQMDGCAAEKNNAATESSRWEEDEPLGDKATKAAVLFVNCNHPKLKEQYPDWQDRVKQIQKIWRTLDVDSRQKYVTMARENRQLRGKVPRARKIAAGSQSGSIDSPTVASPAPDPNAGFPVVRQPTPQQQMPPHQQMLGSNFKVPTMPGGMPVPMGGMPVGPPQPQPGMGAPPQVVQMSQMQPQQPQYAGQPINPEQMTPEQQQLHQQQLHQQQQQQHQMMMARQMAQIPPEVVHNYCNLRDRTNALAKHQTQIEEDLNKMRKQKKNLAAKRRQLIKTAEGAGPNGLPPGALTDLNETDRALLDQLCNGIPARQKDLEKVKQDVKNHNQITQDFLGKHGVPMEVFEAHILRMQQNGQLMAPGPGRPPQYPQHMQQGPPHAVYPPGHPGFQQMRVPHQVPYGAIMAGPAGPAPPHPAHPADPNTMHRMRFPRSPFLASGRIMYERIQNPLERDVYECVDDMISQVCLMMDRDPRDSMMLKRLLEPAQGGVPPHIQQQPVGHLGHPGAMQPGPSGAGQPGVSYAGDPATEPPARKKKRTQVKKATSVASNEYDAMVDRVVTHVKLCEKMPRRSLENMQSRGAGHLPEQASGDLPRKINDISPAFIPDLRERRTRSPIEGEHTGHTRLSVMDDVFEKDGPRGPRAGLAPEPSMAALAPAANIQMLMQQRPPSPLSFVYDDVDISHGSSGWDWVKTLSSGVPRRPLEDVLRLTQRVPDHVPNLEPLREAFLKPLPEPEDVEFTVDACELNALIDQKPSTSSGSPSGSNNAVRALFDQLSSLIGVKTEITYTMDTPPLSPTEPDSFHNLGAIVKKEICDDGPSQAGKCRACDIQMLVPSVTQSISRLGLTPSSDDGREDTVSFCSMRCYYSFVAIQKVALSPDQLSEAERHADEETLSRLRQISAENFAKCIQGKVKLEQAAAPVLADSLLTSPRDGRLGSEECGRKEYVQVIKASDLPNLNDPNGSGRKEAGSNEAEDRAWGVFSPQVQATFTIIQKSKKDIAVHMPKLGVLPFPQEGDQRKCTLCSVVGDADTSVQGRLLNVDAAQWVHVNCALWSAEVYENPQTGGMSNVVKAVERAVQVICHLCGRLGASLQCHKADCESGFHLPCARSIGGKFLKDRTFICPKHHDVACKVVVPSLEALRRLYIERDENALLTKLFEIDSPKLQLRIGSLSLHSLGQLLPEHLKAFHNANYIFPLGFRVCRLFWDPLDPRRRVPFFCQVTEKDGKPWFEVSLDKRLRGGGGATPTDAWRPVLEVVKAARDRLSFLQFFPAHLTGELLFGLTESAITKITESLPGVDTLYTYTFRHGGAPILELPLAENPSGCARCEPRFRTLIKKHRSRPMALVSSCNGAETSSSSSSSQGGRTRGERPRSTYDQELAAAQTRIPSGIAVEWLAFYGKQCVEPQTKAQIYSAYLKMRKDWKNTVYLARSKIQGLGLYANRDIDMGSMIIEYKGELIRKEVCEAREKRYNAQNRGVYMFSMGDKEEDLVVDATMAGGCARYINHSCDPNCSTRIIQTGSNPEDKKIIITANRPIKAHEELTYDYQFELEEDTKVPCLCGAPNCQKWMN